MQVQIHTHFLYERKLQCYPVSSLIVLNPLSRMDRQRREEEVKYRSSKKGQEAEQVILNRVSLVYLLL